MCDKPIDWSAEFNALPKDVRTIGAAMECRTRIQHLRFEKDRLQKRHKQSLSEINEHIKSCEDALARVCHTCDRCGKPVQLKPDGRMYAHDLSSVGISLCAGSGFHIGDSGLLGEKEAATS